VTAAGRLFAEHVHDVLEGVRREHVGDLQLGVASCCDRVRGAAWNEHRDAPTDGPGGPVDGDDPDAIENEVRLVPTLERYFEAGAASSVDALDADDMR
jgi:hypothetical protein